MSDIWTDRLSEYLDGGLSPDEVAAFESHLAGCSECSTVLEELRGVVARARSLDDVEPAADLWPGIREAIGAEDRAMEVIEFASRRPAATSKPRRRVNLTIPQLMAAGIALAFISGAGALSLRPKVGWNGGATLGDGALPVRMVEADLGTAPPLGDETQTRELAELEELLTRHKHELSPNTVRILEKNLAAIDRAIQESLQALAVDPGNVFLEGHVERSYQRKLEYLREASATFQWST
jgi:hypothetical protein